MYKFLFFDVDWSLYWQMITIILRTPVISTVFLIIAITYFIEKKEAVHFSK